MSNNTTCLGSRSGAGSQGMEPGSSACRFPGRAAADPEDSGGLLDQGPIDVCDLGSQTLILTCTLPCVLNSALRGDHCPTVGSAPGVSWDLNLTLPKTRTLHWKLSQPRSLTLHLSCPIAWALTSGLEEEYETRVASALATSLERNLTLAKALSPRGPNTKMWQHHVPGVHKQYRLSGHGTWKLSISFPRWLQLPERIPEASPTRGPSTCVALAAKDWSWPVVSLVPSSQPFGETTGLLRVRRM